jgi:hypothetical protein
MACKWKASVWKSGTHTQMEGRREMFTAFRERPRRKFSDLKEIVRTLPPRSRESGWFKGSFEIGIPSVHFPKQWLSADPTTIEGFQFFGFCDIAPLNLSLIISTRHPRPCTRPFGKLLILLKSAEQNQVLIAPDSLS